MECRQLNFAQSPPRCRRREVVSTEAGKATLLELLEQVCDEIFKRWDKDMRSGKLLSALSGRVNNYDPRVTAIRAALSTGLERAYLLGVTTGRAYWDGYYGSDEAVMAMCWEADKASLLKD